MFYNEYHDIYILEKNGNMVKAYKVVSSSVIELIGDVGAGKTTLVKGIGRGLGVTDTIQPSYTIFVATMRMKKPTSL